MIHNFIKFIKKIVFNKINKIEIYLKNKYFIYVEADNHGNKK